MQGFYYIIGSVKNHLVGLMAELAEWRFALSTGRPTFRKYFTTRTSKNRVLTFLSLMCFQRQTHTQKKYNVYSQSTQILRIIKM